MRKNIYFILILTTFALFTACNNGSVDTIDNDTTAIPESETIAEEVEEIEQTEEIEQNTVTEEVAPAPKAKKEQYSGGKETLYISTYGANGKVWGHVTMNGNTGRGTIHDDDENTYSITVTRHGGELFGIDQNGRQYVFKM